MQSRATCDMVVVRAFVVTALSLVLAVVGHVTAGGLLPSGWPMLAIAALCFAGCALWLAHETSRWSLALLLIAAQTTIHFAMTALAGHAGDGGHAGHAGHARGHSGHGGHAPVESSPTAALADAAHHMLDGLATDGPMMAAHLAAAAATGILLGHAERALWKVLALAARAAGFMAPALRLLFLPVAPAPATRLPRTRADDAPRRTSVRLADTHARRGPPGLLLAR